MDDVTRPEDLQKRRTDGTQPDQTEHPDFRKNRREGGPDTSATKPVEQGARRRRAPRKPAGPHEPAGAAPEPKAPGGQQAPGEEPARR
jgi:hypothetical protein